MKTLQPNEILAVCTQQQEVLSSRANSHDSQRCQLITVLQCV